MKLKNIFTIGTLLFSAAFFGQQKNFSDYDSNRNNTIEKEEFIDVYKNEYSENVPMGTKTEISREDFYKMVFSELDRDRDENLNEDEWNIGLEYLYRDYLSKDYNLTDKDENSVIDYDEYYEQAYQTDYFTYWDVDKDEYLNEDERVEAVFTAFDSNDDGLLEKSEFDRFNSFYLRK